jgi:hypothetical protein
MNVIQIECQCTKCQYKWFYLPFEETRLIRAEILRYGGYREHGRWGGRHPADYPRSSGCGCTSPGCLFLEGFACAEVLDGCGCLGCATMPLTFIGGVSLLAPLTHLFAKLFRKDLPQYHRACPACGSGMFERNTVLYRDGMTELLASITHLPVINPIVVTAPSEA